MHRQHFATIGLVSLLATYAAAQIDQDMLDLVKTQVVPVVEKATGVDLSHVTIRFANTKELAKLLTADAKTQAKATKMTDARCRVFGRSVSKMALGKFSWTTNEILMCPGNFKWQARALDEPKLNALEAFRAVMVHECVHAVDEKTFGWSKLVGSIAVRNELLAYNAVIEGHAQHVAAKICKDNGWDKGFATYTSIIGATSPDAEVGEKLLNEITAANIVATYRDGQRFVAYLHTKLGEKGVAKAFAQPPADFEAILNPEWYLDPGLRPKKLYEFGKPLKRFGQQFDTAVWTKQKVTLSTPQLQAAMSLLSKEDIDRVLSHLKNNEMLIVNDKRRPNDRLLVAGLYEFDSPSEARFYVIASKTLSKKKDESMKKGWIRIVAAKYTQLDEPGLRGLLARKTLKVGNQSVPVTTVIATKGSVGVELLYSNEKVTDAVIKAQARELLAWSAAKKKAEKKEAPQKAGPSRTADRRSKLQFLRLWAPEQHRDHADRVLSCNATRVIRPGFCVVS